MIRPPIALAVPLLLALLTSGAPAQTPPVVAPPPGAAAAPQMRMPGISPAGNAVLTRLQRDPGLEALEMRQRELAKSMVAIAGAPTVDIDRLAAAMREGRAIQGRARDLADARVIAVLRALPLADRKPFLRAVMGSPVPPAR